jgi:hypothetical protein
MIKEWNKLIIYRITMLFIGTEDRPILINFLSQPTREVCKLLASILSSTSGLKCRAKRRYASDTSMRIVSEIIPKIC